MGIFARVRQYGFRKGGNNRISDHAPACVRHELHPEALKGRYQPGFVGLIVRCASAGNHNRHIHMLLSTAAQRREPLDFADREMRIAERDEIDALIVGAVEFLPTRREFLEPKIDRRDADA